jgi:ABC-type multidrug transport system fused ATPase/permease subunit
MLHKNLVCSYHFTVFLYFDFLSGIISGTIQENILFGCRMNEEFYKKVIRACALEDDFKNLSGGDKSEIGERGVNIRF